MSPYLLLSNSTITNNTTNYGPFGDYSTAAGAQIVNRSSVAALAFLAWDILITFGDEVRLIWPRSWNYMKVAYLFVRYVPLMVQITILLIGSELTPHFHFTSHDCYIWQIYQGAAASAIVIVVDTILILRLFALYHDNTLIQRVVFLFFALEVIGMVVGLALSLPGITYDKVCLVVGAPWELIIYGGASILFQTVLFGLTAWKFFTAMRAGWGSTPIITLLMRDGTWAFFLLFLVYIGQVGLYGVKNHAVAGVLYGWLLTAFSFSGYRILLNLNQLSNMDNNNIGSGSQTDTYIQFTSLYATTAGSQALDTTDSSNFEMSLFSGGRYDSSQTQTSNSSYR